MPVHPDGVAEPWNWTVALTAAVVGAEAEQLRVQLLLDTVMVPVRSQRSPSAMTTNSQVYVPGAS